jgi:hypothetical protein
MTPALVALIAGWFLFIIVWLLWSFWSYLQTLQEGSGRRPLSSPKRNTLHHLLFAIIALAWVSLILGLIGLTGGAPVGLDDLVCFWIIMIPTGAFAIIMAHLIDRQRIERILEEQKSEGKDSLESEE